MKTAIRDPVELCRVLSLPPEYEPAAVRAAELFPVFVPRRFAAKMKPGDPHDPLLCQVLPLRDELTNAPGFTADPVGDVPATLAAGLIQKYHGRVLLITTGACAVHCRYCFRRHFPYSTTPRSLADWQPALDLIAADSTVEEVLLSGGDPLTLVDGQLAQLAGRLAEVPHVRRLRVHTRLPILIPERVTRKLLAWLRGTRLVPLVVVHANHPAELDAPVAAALGRLVDAGIPVLNQAVLLRGVNDDVEVLAELCRRLVNLRVMPYYLHQLDRVAGAGHFEVPIEQGRRLVARIRELLPGYAVPRYVQEIGGAPAKTVLL
jgi:EF-P beta-lysylation protein EpmB